MEQLQSLNGLFQLIAHFKIKISESHKIKVTDSNNNMNQMKKKLEEAASQYDQNLSKSAKKLERLVPDIQEKIRKIDERLQDPCLDDKNQSIKKIVNYLAELKLDIDEMLELTQKTNRFQKALQFEVSDFEKINYIQEQFFIIERLWIGRKLFYEYLESVSTIHFLKLDYQNLENHMNSMKKTAAQCSKDLETNEVCKIYRQEVNTLITYVDTIRYSFKPGPCSTPRWETKSGSRSGSSARDSSRATPSPSRTSRTPNTPSSSSASQGSRNSKTSTSKSRSRPRRKSTWRSNSIN